jgi:hypothetical protein
LTVIRLRETNPDAVAVAETSPWPLLDWPQYEPGAVVIVEENMMGGVLAERDRPAAVLLMDAVRQQGKGIPQALRCPVFTMDAPLDGATFLWTPLVPDEPGPLPSERRGGALFSGKIMGYRQRERMLNDLREYGVTVRLRENAKTGLDDFRRSLLDYAALVNMAGDRKTGLWQMKGRVIEAGMAGCVLLEQRNPVTAIHFIEGTDYLAWDSPKELPGLIARVRSGEADGIAQSLAAKVRGMFSSDAFWATVAAAVDEWNAENLVAHIG